MALPVDVIIDHLHGSASFVRDGDLARSAKRHRPITVAGPSERAVANHHGLEIALVTMPDAEKIAQRDVDAGGLAAVVIDPQSEQPGPRKLVVGDGKPDVTDDAGSAEVGHDVGFAGHDALAVVVAAHEAVAAGDPLGGVRLHSG